MFLSKISDAIALEKFPLYVLIIIEIMLVIVFFGKSINIFKIFYLPGLMNFLPYFICCGKRVISLLVTPLLNVYLMITSLHRLT
jgi:hypothetical protein